MSDETDTTKQPEAEAASAAASPGGPAPGVVAPGGAVPPGHARRRTGDKLLPLLTLAGFIILGGGLAYVWTRPTPMPPMPPIPPDQSGIVAALKSEVGSLQSSLYALDMREQADVAALHAAIAAIPMNPSGPGSSAPRQAAPQPGAPQPGAPLPTASDAAIADLRAQIDALRTAQSMQVQAAQSLPSAASVTALSGRVDAMAEKQGADAEALSQRVAALKAEIDALNAEAQSLTQSTKALPQLSARSDRLALLMRAEAALSAGAPLGDIPNAPPALSRFASAAPPTEASLVLRYPDAARAAEAAGAPISDRGRFWHRIWVNVQRLVTVRQGDRVIVGDPTSGILAHAGRLLAAGDLPGTLAVLATLQGPAATAMAPWMADAQALVDARQALAQMAAAG